MNTLPTPKAARARLATAVRVRKPQDEVDAFRRVTNAAVIAQQIENRVEHGGISTEHLSVLVEMLAKAVVR